ncbi:MAG: response regulator [bacterium]|nr:response regulator [bacterium]
MENFKSINILLVEDNEDDILIIQRAFKKLKLTNEIYVVRDGQEGLDFIFHEGIYAQNKPPTPGLILLDINMPKLNGFQVLERIKAHPVYKVIPVIMLTVSDRDEDIVRSYQNGAVSYITKPMDFEDFVKVIEQFEIYWSLVSKIPEVR